MYFLVAPTLPFPLLVPLYHLLLLVVFVSFPSFLLGKQLVLFIYSRCSVSRFSLESFINLPVVVVGFKVRLRFLFLITAVIRSQWVRAFKLAFLYYCDTSSRVLFITNAVEQ